MEIFSSDYNTARQKFIGSVNQVGPQVENIHNTYSRNEREGLFIDLAIIGPKKATKFIVLISGTHGVEGFAGSGIQTGLIEDGLFNSLPDDVAILLIHALNPYGMANYRRFNEDSVDLNRNFRDHSTPSPRNDFYEKFANVIAPRSMSLSSELISWVRLLWFRIIAGKQELRSAISKGQYSHPQGLFYGGKANAWSNTILRQIIIKYLSGAKQVIVLDFHTGLGKFGAAKVILNTPELTPEYKRAKAIWGENIVETTADGESVSAHFDTTLKLAIPKLLPNTEVTAVSLEFGTFPTMEVFKALRAENWLHHHADATCTKMDIIKNNLLQAFYPNSIAWKNSVWRQGKKTVEQALKYLSSE